MATEDQDSVYSGAVFTAAELERERRRMIYGSETRALDREYQEACSLFGRRITRAHWRSTRTRYVTHEVPSQCIACFELLSHISYSICDAPVGKPADALLAAASSEKAKACLARICSESSPEVQQSRFERMVTSAMNDVMQVHDLTGSDQAVLWFVAKQRFGWWSDGLQQIAMAESPTNVWSASARGSSGLKCRALQFRGIWRLWTSQATKGSLTLSPRWLPRCDLPQWMAPRRLRGRLRHARVGRLSRQSPAAWLENFSQRFHPFQSSVQSQSLRRRRSATGASAPKQRSQELLYRLIISHARFARGTAA